jgi:hypothetical protein
MGAVEEASGVHKRFSLRGGQIVYPDLAEAGVVTVAPVVELKL